MRLEQMTTDYKGRPRANISAARTEVAMARVGYLISGQEEKLTYLPMAGAAVGERIKDLSPAQAERVLIGNIALLKEISVELAGSDIIVSVRETIETGLVALQRASEIEVTIYTSN